MKKMKYVGYIINKNGRISDSARTSAIKEMSALKNVKTLRPFLGLLTITMAL